MELSSYEIQILTAMAVASDPYVPYKRVREKFSESSPDTTYVQDALICRRTVLSLRQKGLLQVPEESLPAIPLIAMLSLTKEGWQAVDSLPLE